MTNEHPVTPLPELVLQLIELPLSEEERLAAAYRAGADQKLEACCEWLDDDDDRAQRQPVPPEPVPVSERLPGPEDMTDDGEVWIEDPGHEYPLADAGDYDWEPHKWILRPIGKLDAQNGLRWLPAHALPLPSREND